MYIVTKISIILMSHCVLGEASRSLTKTSRSFPSRLYLPTSPNPEPKNRARTSDIEAVLENDLQVIPLAVDHDQRNGFQYQPIISRKYSRGSTESPRYSQSAVQNLLLQSGNTRRILGSPISNGNDAVKPITKSQLSREAVACSSTPKRNNPSQDIQPASFWCLRGFRNLETPLDQIPENSPSRKILTVNDQGNNTERERLNLQLTPPNDGIPKISRHRIDEVPPPASSTRSVSASGPRSKETILIGQDIKPVFERNEYGTNYDNYNNPDDCSGRDYQLGNCNTAAFAAGSFNGPSEQSEVTCSDILKQFLLQAHQRYNYGYNTHQHIPTNPILALLLSHYGRYIPGLPGPRAYSYMAVNNIHNNKPFGSYKLTRDDDVNFAR